MSTFNAVMLTREQSSFNVAVTLAKMKMAEGRKVIFCTGNQQTTVNWLQEYFPNAMIELIGTWGVRVHERKLENDIAADICGRDV